MAESGSVHTVTGATGFLGSVLVLELLLEKSDSEVICLTRPEDDRERAAARLRAALHTASEIYGHPELRQPIDERCHAVAFDLRSSGQNTLRKLPARIGEVWHAAASLRFKARHRESIRDRNVDGTRRLLEVALARKASSFNHISTAYVAGRRTGRIAETVLGDQSVAQNAYEESKIEAEQLVDAWDGCQTRIMRPSIVIGHSATHAAISSSGLYSFILGVRRVKREVLSRKLGDFLAHRPLRLRGDADTAINLIPVDVVARNAIAISRSGHDAKVFHVVNADPPPAHRVSSAVFPELGMAAPRWVEDRAEFTLIDEKLDEEPRTGFFRSYLSSSRVFDLTNTDAALGPEASRVPLDREALGRYVRWYLGHIERVQTEQLRRRRAEALLPAAGDRV